MAACRYKALFTDVGGVIATNGWDTPLREKMIAHFALDPHEVDSRHHLMFDSYERGYITLEQYLQWVVFYERRPFSVGEVMQWIFDQGQTLPGTYELYQTVKRKNTVRVGLISNEGGGLTEDRVKRFRLDEIADFMVFSNVVNFRKPDPQMWQLALKLSQLRIDEAIYIDDRQLFVDFAASLGFRACRHTSAAETGAFLSEAGFETA